MAAGGAGVAVVGHSDLPIVSVVDSETWVEAKRFTVYKVVVRAADRAYFMFRR